MHDKLINIKYCMPNEKKTCVSYTKTYITELTRTT